MTQVERRDQKPEPSEEPQEKKTTVTRRDFLVGAGSLVVGGVIGGVVGTQLDLPEATPEEEPAAEAEAEAPAAEAEAPSQYLAGHTIVFDPYQCTGCMKCAFACAEKYSKELYPDETQHMVNLEFARIRPMRFQYVDVVNVCTYCTLEEWAEGSSEFPCAEVCPEDAIVTIPEGEGKEGVYGMGYKWIDRDKCLGIDKCWRCAEICEDQFASGISFDPIEKKAQVCSRCGGDPECVKVCPEPLALQWVPASRNGRYFANQPTAYAELLYRKMYQKRREL
jgi:Fe-S-cluster-containing hydrogenase component 2